MPKSINFNERSTENELLDQIDLNENEVRKNLNEFITLNKYLGTHSTLINSLDKIYSKYEGYFKQNKIRIVDLGCGAGDSLIEMDRFANKRNITIDLIGIDNNPLIVDVAKKNVHSYQNISIKNMDIMSFSQEENNADIICLNNVLHHFKTKQIIELLPLLYSKTNLAIIINDLRREPLSYYGIKIISKLFNMSNLAQNDGPLSVLKAFSEEDLRQYLELLNLHDFEITKSFAFRWQVIIFTYSR